MGYRKNLASSLCVFQQKKIGRTLKLSNFKQPTIWVSVSRFTRCNILIKRRLVDFLRSSWMHDEVPASNYTFTLCFCTLRLSWYKYLFARVKDVFKWFPSQRENVTTSGVWWVLISRYDWLTVWLACFCFGLVLSFTSSSFSSKDLSRCWGMTSLKPFCRARNWASMPCRKRQFTYNLQRTHGKYCACVGWKWTWLPHDVVTFLSACVWRSQYLTYSFLVSSETGILLPLGLSSCWMISP